MVHLIKRINKGDLSDITEFVRRLYPDKTVSIKDINLLHWLMSDPSKPDSYNGFIARNENQEVTGIIGYSLNTYQYKDLKFTGVIPMSWLVSPTERGILGIQLLMKVMKMGDFGFAIHGSKDAINSYSAVKLKYAGVAYMYTKVLKIKRYAWSKDASSLIWWMKAFYYFGRGYKYLKNKSLMLQDYSGEPDHNNDITSDLAMIPSEERNQWIMNCPKMEILAFSLILKGNKVGSCLAFIYIGRYDLLRGRIVHVPFLGDDVKKYRQVISMIENELMKRGCCSVTVIAMNQYFRKALHRQCYKYIWNTARKVFIKDSKNLLVSIPISNWHLTYYESDKSYIDV